MKIDEKLFTVLRKINSEPNINQRMLAKQLKFSLGKVNYCLMALKKRGLIKINNFKISDYKIRYSYILTPKGITQKSRIALKFLKQKAKEYEELKKEINNN